MANGRADGPRNRSGSAGVTVLTGGNRLAAIVVVLHEEHGTASGHRRPNRAGRRAASTGRPQARVGRAVREGSCWSSRREGTTSMRWLSAKSQRSGRMLGLGSAPRHGACQRAVFRCTGRVAVTSNDAEPGVDYRCRPPRGCSLPPSSPGTVSTRGWSSERCDATTRHAPRRSSRVPSRSSIPSVCCSRSSPPTAHAAHPVVLRAAQKTLPGREPILCHRKPVVAECAQGDSNTRPSDS